MVSPAVQMLSPEASAASSTDVTTGSRENPICACSPLSSPITVPFSDNPLDSTRAVLAPASSAPTVCENLSVVVPEPPV